MVNMDPNSMSNMLIQAAQRLRDELAQKLQDNSIKIGDQTFVNMSAFSPNEQQQLNLSIQDDNYAQKLDASTDPQAILDIRIGLGAPDDFGKMLMNNISKDYYSIDEMTKTCFIKDPKLFADLQQIHDGIQPGARSSEQIRNAENACHDIGNNYLQKPTDQKPPAQTDLQRNPFGM